ncbi:MAG: D-glycero-alpha-D-manno-heptose-1,7-bisphosphate 7-phosphatase [Nitriliruptorales bacterium]
MNAVCHDPSASTAAGPDPMLWRPSPQAVLLDRDGTLIADVPYNGDPALVRALPGAHEALERLRAARVRLAVVTNQSGMARGLLSSAQVAAVNASVEALLGPFDGFYVCPHGPEDGCDCRKPAPGLVLKAAADLGIEPGRCAVIGDIGSDVAAAQAAGARGILVPTATTRPEEVLAAPEVARDLSGAVDLLLHGAAA